MSALTPQKISELVEFCEADAKANFYLCAPYEFARKFRFNVQRLGSVWVTMIAELDLAYFNRIVGLGVGNSATKTLLDDIVGLFEGAGCRNYLAQISPMARPSSIQEWLAERGFTRGRNTAKWYRGDSLATSVPTDLQVQTIGKDFADAYAEVSVAALSMPPELSPFFKGTIGLPGWHHYLAFDGDKPVSAAAMYVKDKVGWLGGAGTLKTHRNRGGQSALLTRRIKDGLKLGCEWFVAETAEDTPDSPNSSYHNILRTGFKLAYLRPSYLHQPTGSKPAVQTEAVKG